MTVKNGLELLEEVDKKRKNLLKKSLVVACSKLGTENQKIIAGTIEKVKSQEMPNPSCLIIPGKLNFKEEEALEIYRV